MNGPTAAEALAGRFRAIRESELARLEKKFRDLTEDDRKSVEAITAQVTDASAQIPQRVEPSFATCLSSLAMCANGGGSPVSGNSKIEGVNSLRIETQCEHRCAVNRAR